MVVPYGAVLLFLVVPLCEAQFHHNHAVSCPRCSGVQHLSNCPTEHCGDSQCAVQQVLINGQYLYYSGCVRDQICDGQRFLGYFHQAGQTECKGCCFDHNSNRHCSLEQICPAKQHVQMSSRCLYCNGERSLKDCQNHQTCRNDEKCFVRKVEVQGRTEYFSGCASNIYCDGTNLTPNINHGGRTLCHKCCADHSGCSLDSLCPEHSTATTTFQCLHCDGEHSLELCHRHDTCSHGQRCYVRQVEVGDSYKYYAGCVTEDLCDGDNYTPQNNHGGTTLCHKCCPDHASCEVSDLCPETKCQLCNGEGSLADCNGFATCGVRETCFVRQEEIHGRLEYFAGCSTDHLCKGTNYISKSGHGGKTLCHRCCPNDHSCSLSGLCPAPLTCLACNGETSLSDCKDHAMCSDNERCAVHQINDKGVVRYYSGCLNENNCQGTTSFSNNTHNGTSLCSQCCPDHSSCDMAQLCPQPKKLNCLHCSGQESLSECTEHMACNLGERCFVRQDEVAGKLAYYSGCTASNHCNDPGIPGGDNQSESINLCSKCCPQNENCNIADLCQPTPQHCLNCKGEPSIEKCWNHEKCKEGQKCYLEKVNDGRSVRYYSGCVQDYQCEGTVLNNPKHHNGTLLCSGCCAHHTECHLDEVCQVFMERHLGAQKPSEIPSVSVSPPLPKTETTTPVKAPTTIGYPPTTATSSQRTTTNKPIVTTKAQDETTETTLQEFKSPSTTTTNKATSTPYPHTYVMETEGFFGCRTCSRATSLDECSKWEVCHYGQVCSLSVVQRTDRKVIFAGCIPEYECWNGKMTSSENPGNVLCGECCADDECSAKMCSNFTSGLGLASTTTETTIKPTTKLTTVPTTKPTTEKTVSTTLPTTESTTTEAQHGSTKAPMMCEVCDGTFCGLFPQTQVACHRNAPYCMNIVDNDDIGNKLYTKKCASFNDCQTRWWEGSSDLAVCTGFDARTPYYYKFQCVYCCTKSGCNADIYPERSTLFKGRS